MHAKQCKFFCCLCFKQDLKQILKKSKNTEAKTLIFQEISQSLKDPSIFNRIFPLLFEEGEFKVYKARIKDPSQRKGKRGGLRLIFTYDEKEKNVLLLRLYRKVEVENVPKEEIKTSLIQCLKQGIEKL